MCVCVYAGVCVCVGLPFSQSTKHYCLNVSLTQRIVLRTLSHECTYVASAGSVVVKYVLEMMKDTKVESETVVSDEIRHNGGNFAGFKVDPDSVKAQGTHISHFLPLERFCVHMQVL